MTGGDDPGPDEGPDERALQSGRAWQHPSEVGLASRGRADRRRSAVVASGVVLGGLGLLFTGVVLGTLKEPTTTTTSTLPVERANLSVATVSVVDDGGSRYITGLVVDDDGHLIVDGVALGDAEGIWARCGDGELQRAEVVGSDPDTDLVLLQMEDPGGVPVSIAPSQPSQGSEVRLLRAHGDVSTATASVAAESPPQPIGQLMNLISWSEQRHFLAALQQPGDQDASPAPQDDRDGLRGSMVFDRAGRLVGMVAEDGGADAPERTVQVLAAADVIGAAEQLIAARG